MLKRFLCYVLCFAMLGTVLPVNMLAETAEDVPLTATEQPLAETPAAEPLITPQAEAEEPLEPPAAIEAPVVEQPAPQAPIQETVPAAPKPEQAGEEPVLETPDEEPVVDKLDEAAAEPEAPLPEEPAPQEEAALEPAEPSPDEDSAVEDPVIEEPSPEDPAIEDQLPVDEADEEPAMEEPLVEEPAVDEPESTDPALDTPVTEEPAAQEPVSDASVPEESVIEDPSSEEPVSEEPFADEPEEELALNEPVLEELAEQPLDEPANYIEPRTASWDLAKPGENLVITLAEGAPSFLGIEGLTLDSDYSVSGMDVALQPDYLNALPLGQTVLTFLFEGDISQQLYLNISDSALVTEEAAPVEEALPDTLSDAPQKAFAVNPLVFDKSSIEATANINGLTYNPHFDIVSLVDYSASLGSPVWTITNQNGSSVSSLKVTSYEYPDQNQYGATVYADEILSAGITTATLTCSVGVHSLSIPVTITVTDLTVPTGISAPSTYYGAVNQAISIPRPSLTPENTGLSAENFSFTINLDLALLDSMEGNSESGYQLTLKPRAIIPFISVSIIKTFILISKRL